MKKEDIKVGYEYIAKVSNSLTVVRVDAMRNSSRLAGRLNVVYDVTNMRTGRTTIFRSAAKFRRAVENADHRNAILELS